MHGWRQGPRPIPKLFKVLHILLHHDIESSFLYTYPEIDNVVSIVNLKNARAL